MLRITKLKLPPEADADAINKRIEKKIHGTITNVKILKESIDARKGVQKVYTVAFEASGEDKIASRNKDIDKYTPEKYLVDKVNNPDLRRRPVIVGSGPAGLFAALTLVEAGLKPIILERGEPIEERDKSIDRMSQEGILNPESNIQFGEGGAGTYSDGKLTTRVKDKRIGYVLDTLVSHGAPDEISYRNKPHVGTDVLKCVIKSIREQLVSLGAEYRFGSKVTDIIVDNDEIKAVVVNGTEVINTDDIILAIGHSARDTFEMLLERKVNMMPKPFAVGYRIEHPQEIINKNQYGDLSHVRHLGQAEYKLTYKASNGRGVYSFCMCPGGYVVNASSEEGRLCVNGMSEHARDGRNANSAILVTLDPLDIPGEHILKGMHFQRQVEEKVFMLGGGDYTVPVQTLGSFLGRSENKEGSIKPTVLPGYKYCDISGIYPAFVIDSIKESMETFGRKIIGFDMNEAILTAAETRSSSPVRILRDEFSFCSNFKGLYPAGEGAGYAGGITSAAIDGIRVAERVIMLYNVANC